MTYHGEWVVWTISPANTQFKVNLTSFTFKDADNLVKNAQGNIKKSFLG